MEEENKLPLKRVELSLSKFNEVAIPHHLDLLRQHKANIIKYGSSSEWKRVRSEQSAACRAAGRLRALLAELDALRRSVRRADRAAFDQRTQRARADTLRAVADYLDVIERSCRDLVYTTGVHRHDSSPLAVPGSGRTDGGPVAASVTSTESVGVVREGEEEGEEVVPLQLRVALSAEHAASELAAREDALRGWGELQAEVRALHDAWQAVQAAALAQRGPAERTERAVEAAAGDVAAARGLLAAAERLRGGAVLAGGAALGALCGGPVGLVVGAKAGAAAALAGSLLGFATVRLFGRRPAALEPAPASDPDPALDKDKDKEV